MAFLIKTELANGETREIFFCDRQSVMRLVTAEMAHDWVKLTLFDDDEVWTTYARTPTHLAPLTNNERFAGPYSDSFAA